MHQFLLRSNDEMKFLLKSIHLSKKMQRESLERQQKLLNRNIVTEILPAKKLYQAEEYHQQYLEDKGEEMEMGGESD